MTQKNIRNKNTVQEAVSKKFWAIYTKNTTMLSAICRQLAFAEGAICWFFMKPENQNTLSVDIKIILLFLVLFFILDACQYLILAIYNKALALFYESKIEDGTITSSNQITRPSWINSSANACFILKLFCIGFASFFLIGKFFFQYFLG